MINRAMKWRMRFSSAADQQGYNEVSLFQVRKKSSMPSRVFSQGIFSLLNPFYSPRLRQPSFDEGECKSDPNYFSEALMVSSIDSRFTMNQNQGRERGEVSLGSSFPPKLSR